MMRHDLLGCVPGLRPNGLLPTYCPARSWPRLLALLGAVGEGARSLRAAGVDLRSARPSALLWNVGP